MTAAPVAAGVKALVRAARRAHDRGDLVERDQLLDEADEQLGLMIEAMPEPRRAPFANWFGWAHRTKRIPANPMHHIPTYKVPRREPVDLFTEAECKLIEVLLQKLALDRDEFKAQEGIAHMTDLSKAQASQVIERLKSEATEGAA